MDVTLVAGERVQGPWSGLRRVVGFMACGRVYGAWSSLWRVVKLMACGRVYGAWRQPEAVRDTSSAVCL
jgi:hypothetical protein